jgi:CRISPR system Cascade subunit CasB
MTVATESPAPLRTAAEAARAFVLSKIVPLQNGYVGAQPTPYSRAALARLRRGVGKSPAECPDLAEFYVDPEERPSRQDPTSREWAAHISIGLYAVHQQSGSQRMHRPGMPFGAAVGSISDQGQNAGVVRRFQALATAADIVELSRHARGVVQLLRQAGQGFDYGEFAADLVRFQDARYTDEVRMHWGRGFYGLRARQQEDTDNKQPEDPAAPAPTA